MKIKQNLVLRCIGHDYVIVAADDEMVNMAVVYTLNGTAAWLWQQLKNTTFTADMMTELLMQRYDVDASRAASDVEQLISDMKKNGLLEDE